MKLRHLHLHVRDRSRAEGFYRDWFGMRLAHHGSERTFMTDEAGFDLALMDDATPVALPSWFHFGYRLQSSDAVVTLHDRMVKADVRIARPLYTDPDLVSFRCADPDGYAVEIYWQRAPASPPLPD
jgi:catechol 2,3-dioxygenase-like lactoylglutathione lyase family enzyme